jgi:sugar (pentulose or hexulose) kinase
MGLHSRTWEEALLKVAGVTADKLPRLVPPGTVAGPLSAAAATFTGLAADTPVVMSGSDNACFKLGAGVEGRGVVCIYIGTAAAVGVISEKPIVDRRLNCCPAALPDLWDVDALLLTAGAAYRWLRDLLNGAGQGEELSFKTMDEMAARIPPGSEGVVVVPHFAGAGSPLWDPDACGQIIGLRLSHGAAHLARAALEGVVFAQRHALDALIEHVPDINRLQLTGGGASDLWSQILADATGLPVSIPRSQQSTCLGAALMAGVAAGIYSDHADAISSTTMTERHIEPDTSKKAVYDAAYKLYLNTLEQDRG